MKTLPIEALADAGHIEFEHPISKKVYKFSKMSYLEYKDLFGSMWSVDLAGQDISDAMDYTTKALGIVWSHYIGDPAEFESLKATLTPSGVNRLVEHFLANTPDWAGEPETPVIPPHFPKSETLATTPSQSNTP